MKKTIKYELTQEEKHLLMKCVNEVAQECGGCCQDGCPFYLEHEDRCILGILNEIAYNCD